jgi:hypothetical protein
MPSCPIFCRNSGQYCQPLLNLGMTGASARCIMRPRNRRSSGFTKALARARTLPYPGELRSARGDRHRHERSPYQRNGGLAPEETPWAPSVHLNSCRRHFLFSVGQAGFITGQVLSPNGALYIKNFPALHLKCAGIFIRSGHVFAALN